MPAHLAPSLPLSNSLSISEMKLPTSISISVVEETFPLDHLSQWYFPSLFTSIDVWWSVDYFKDVTDSLRKKKSYYQYKKKIHREPNCLGKVLGFCKLKKNKLFTITTPLKWNS